MGILKRIGRLFKMIVSLFVEGLEDSQPLERRLAYDRQEKAQKFRQMMDAATDVGAQAELMVTGLAQAQISAVNIREEIAGHLRAAKAAALRGDEVTRRNEEAAAAALADDLGEAEADLKDLEDMVKEALKDQEEARQMVLAQARELQRLAQYDSRLLVRVRMTEMRVQTLALREAMANFVPEDNSQIRARAEDQARKRAAKVSSRKQLVDALLAQQEGRTVRSVSTRRGAEILEEMSKEIGYQSANTPQSEAASQATQG